MTCKNQKAKNAKITNHSLFSYNKGQKVNNAKLISSIVTTFTSKDQKTDDIRICAEDAIKKTYTSCIIKLFRKAKNAKKPH